MNASVSPGDGSTPARSVSSSRTQPWISPTMWSRPLMSPSSEQPFERRTVLENPQCGAVRIDVTGADRFEERPDTVGRAPQSALEPAAELLVEDVEELALAPLARTLRALGIGREEGPVPGDRVQH